MRVRLKIKEIAEAKGFNQSSLSRAANVDFKTVKRAFRDPYRDIAVSTLAKLAQALKVDISELVETLPDEG